MDTIGPCKYTNRSTARAKTTSAVVRVVAGRVLNELDVALHENERRWERFYPVR